MSSDALAKKSDEVLRPVTVGVATEDEGVEGVPFAEELAKRLDAFLVEDDGAVGVVAVVDYKTIQL